MAYAYSGLGEAPATQPPKKAPYLEFAVYQYTVSLTAGQELDDQTIAIDSDSDFVWAKTSGTKTGDYELNIRLPDGRRICSAMVRDSIIIGTAQFPVPVVPHVFCPAGGHIGIDIHDLSGAANTVSICLLGWRRYARK